MQLSSIIVNYQSREPLLTCLRTLAENTAGLATENSVFVLKGDNVETCIVQKFGTLSIIVDHLFPDLKAYCRRIVIGATGVRHGDDASLKILVRCQDRSM